MAFKARFSRRALYRALLVLGVLCGLLSMHGLTANHDPLMAMPQGAASAPAHRASTTVMTEPMSMFGPDRQTPSAAPGATVTTDVDRGRPGGRGSHSAMELCLAILGSAMALLLLLGTHPRQAPLFVAAARIRTRWRCSRWPSRVFALSPAQLCLSRT